MSIEIKANVNQRVNYAGFHLKQQVLIGDIRLQNIAADTLVLQITSVPEFLYPYKQELKATGSEMIIASPELKLNDGFYRTELIEAQDGEIRIELYHPDTPEHILGFLNTTVHIQPYLHWDASMPQTMAGFIQPNDPLVLNVLKLAGEYASEEGESMCGYQCGTERGVKKQAEYIYRALQDLELHYISAPASFEVNGQKIRIPHQVLHEEAKQGTCLDLAILYATCLEAASLYGVVVVIPGHAFSGVWLNGRTMKDPLTRPSTMGREAFTQAVEKLYPVECTTFTDGKDCSFSSAVSIAQSNMKECLYLIDVERSRYAGLVPVYTFTDKPICDVPPEEEINPLSLVEYTSEKKDRLTLLREQAMDISIRSHLLNGKANTLSIPLSVKAEQFFLGNSNEEELYRQIRAAEQKATERSNKSQLRDLYAAMRESLREKGENTLYISINTLEWKNEKGNIYEAPLYLCPAELYRNMRGDLGLHVHLQKTFFNPVLKAFLDQICHLDSSALMDNPGDKYQKQMELLQFMIENQKDWSIREDVAHLEILTIPNESIRKGLYDSKVLSHEIVKGIVQGEMNWENELTADEKEDASCGVYCYEADSSQQEIIESAFRRKAQLVAGPAGNGKTQTGVNIMLEAIRRGEHVLFISEKASAMEVAKEKLEEVLGERFILSLLPGKTTPAAVMNQIRNNLDLLEYRGRAEENNGYESAKKKYLECLNYLETYYDRMNRKLSCGKSLQELIKMYETYVNSPFQLTLDESCASIPLEEAEDEIGVLAGMLEEYDRIRGKFEKYVRYDQPEDEKGKTLELAQATLRYYRRLLTSAETFWDKIDQKGIREDNEKEQLKRIIRIAGLLTACPVYHKSFDEILTKRPTDEEYRTLLINEIRKYSRRQSPFTKRRQREKCEDLLQQIYPVREANDLLDAAEKDPESLIRQINSLHIVNDSEGDIYIEKESAESKNITAFMDTVESELAEESEAVTDAVKRTLELIVQGKATEIRGYAETVMADYRRYSQALKEISGLIIHDPAEFSREHPNLPKTVLINEWIKNRNADRDRISTLCHKIKNELEEKGYGCLIRQLTEQKAFDTTEAEYEEDSILDSYYKAWAQYQIDCAEDDLITDGINIISYRDKVRQMLREERKVRDGLRQEIIRTQLNRIGNPENGISNNPEFGNLQKLVRKRKTPIRSFFEEAPNMLMTLCPCMIMSPTAAAEYLPSDFPMFDLVLIDEGSQMPTCNAMIPISHAKRCMIFGDEKQLRPSEMFRRKLKEEFDVDAERESILTSAYITSMPRKMLRFHYRSEDESLIAFSNSMYYNNNIITFPSSSSEIHGISYEYVEDGWYDLEKTKANPPEAKRVVAKIREVYGQLPEETELTLGVVTLNIHQRNYIQKLLFEEMASDQTFALKADKLVSIVNLERCQGKEWDIVILSPGFATNKDGKIVSGFGALNREYGANRLNVMLTRARRKMMVITSLEPYMLSGISGQGVEDLRKFLLYAKGEMKLDSRRSGSCYASDVICRNIAVALEEAGYKVHMNIGSSDFKVDIGVVSKKDKNRYCLGFLMDRQGDVYSVHDREVICPQILEAKGWKLYRLHTLNWNSNPQREIRKILKMLVDSE